MIGFTLIAKDNLGTLHCLSVILLAEDGAGTSPLHVDYLAVGGVGCRIKTVRARLRGALVHVKLQTFASRQQDSGDVVLHPRQFSLGRNINVSKRFAIV